MNYKPISIIQLTKIQSAIKAKYDLVVPSYTITLPNGNRQIVKHDADSIADKNTPQAEKDAWETYNLQLAAMQSEINEKSMGYMFAQGIDCEIDNEWLALQEWLGITLPTNKYDLKVYYITTELFKTPAEIKKAIQEIMMLSTRGVDSSTVEAAESMFRRTVSDK